MASLLFSADPLWKDNGLAIIRIVTGLLMMYHGWEIFSPETMAPYVEWEVVKALPAPKEMVYLGKGLELVTGICFVLGLFTRPAAVFMAVDMLFICFIIGNGKFYYQDQHPFLFALIAMIFFFTGPVKWSIDKVWFNKQ